jgi:hypothetical protein
MKFFLIALPLCVLGVSCERHSFEETKQLHEKHETHGTQGAEHADAETHGSEKKAEEHGH